MNGPRPSRIAPAELPPRRRVSATARASSSVSNALYQFLMPIEWHGTYSPDKLLGLLSYASSSSTTRVGLVLMLTPLPALVACLLIEWLIPLADPARGLRGNAMFLVRTWVRCSLTSFAVDALIELYVPKVRLPRYRLLLMNAVQGAVASAAIVAISSAARVFPIPFSPTTTMPIYAAASWLLRFACDRESHRCDPDPATTRRAMAGIMQAVNFAAMLVYLYSFFCMLFTLTPSRWQPSLTLALVVIKAVATRGEWRRAQALMASGRNDLATALVAFGAQYFHALFVTTCIQKTTSFQVLVALVALTLTYKLTTIHELRGRLARVRRLRRQLDPLALGRVVPPPHEHLRGLALRWQSQVSVLGAATTAPFPGEAWLLRLETPAVVDSAGLRPLSHKDREYLEAVAALLQCREATLLRLYVDVFVPCVFLAFVASIKVLPNGAYMPFLHTNDLGELARRLGVQLGVKLAALALLLHTLREDGLGAPGGLTQLAFALDRMAVVVHAKSLFAALCVFDFTLAHNGNDLTFHFAWLTHRPT